MANQAGNSGNFCRVTFPTKEKNSLITVLDIGGYYYFRNPFSSDGLYYYNVGNRWISGTNNKALGIRILIQLKEGVSIVDSVGSGTMDSKLELVKNT